MAELNETIGNFERAVGTWEEINLPELQKSLDQEAIDIKENQKQLLLTRKELATKTKSFRKLEDSEKLEEIKPLLKAYQNEIDHLTKKSKVVETLFFKVYRTISDAPDPEPLLTSSIKSFKRYSETSSLKEANAKLQEKLARYSDYETIKAKLLSQEQRSAESLNVKLLLQEDEYKSKTDEVEKKYALKELDFERQIASLQKKLEEVQALNQISKNKLKAQRELLGEKGEDDDHDDEDGDEEASVGLDRPSRGELDLLTRNLQTSKAKTLELEKRNQELRESLQKSQGSEELTRLNERIEELEVNNSVLLQKTNVEKRNHNKQAAEINEQVETLKAKNESYVKKIADIKKNLSKYLDYDDIKSELTILRSIELDLDDTEEKSIDHGLMSRNRKLNNETVELRNKNTQLEQTIHELNEKLKTIQNEQRNLKNTNDTLESNIASLRGNSGNDWDTMSMYSGTSRMPPRSQFHSSRPKMPQGRLSPAASIAGFDDNESYAETPVSISGDSNILPIITQQRDRYRAKNIELESKARSSTQTINDLKRQITLFNKKNSDLATEVKFLQTNAGSKKSQQVANNPYSEQFASGTYEGLMNDYDSFSYIENSKVLRTLQTYIGSDNAKKVDRKLNDIERFFFSFLKLVLKNHTTRTIFIGYWTFIHVLFFISIVRFLFFSASTGPATTSAADYSLGSPMDPVNAPAQNAADNIKVN